MFGPYQRPVPPFPAGTRPCHLPVDPPPRERLSCVLAMEHMFRIPVILALLTDEGTLPWPLRRWAESLRTLSPRACLAGGAIYLDLSWQRGREREAALRALSLAPEGLRERARKAA